MAAGNRTKRLFNYLVASVVVVVGSMSSAAPLPEGNGVSAIATTPHVTTQWVAERDAVVPGQSVRVALDQTVIEGWHTYWINPGETGLPTRIKWTLPPGWEAGPIAWPTPRRFMVGTLVNYGYQGQVRLLTELRAPASAETGKPVTLVAEANWLVCEQMCVPERIKLTLTLGVTPGNGTPVPGAGEIFRQADLAMPHKSSVIVSLVEDAKTSRLDWRMEEGVREAIFFPEDKNVLKPDGAQTLTRDGDSYHLVFAQRPVLNSGPLKGILSIDGRGIPIVALPVSAPNGLTSSAPAEASRASEDAEAITLWHAVVLALLGGTILNLMPCVFPVLSMKAFALARHGRTYASQHGLAYAAGVILCFVAIAGLLLAWRAAGSHVGWGFQLQSPVVVAILAYVMVLLGLSMSGVFMMGTSVMGVGSDLAGREGLSGSFFTGVLATVVAAPCTAPFMGAAVAYALLQSWWVSLVVFAALGAGMALPFVLLTCFDPLLRLIPKPGIWMERLKQILAFPLYATAGWLVWVLTIQTGVDGLAAVLAGCILVALAAYLYGQHFSGSWRWLGHGVAVVSVFAAVALPMALPASPTKVNEVAQAGEPRTFSEQAVSVELAAGRPVFVDFTAAWCITCLANERVALSRDGVQEAMRRKNVTFMEADWTNQDSAITSALEKFGRSGVPLYLLYAPGGAKPQILPQLLTEDIVLRALGSLPDARAAP